MLVPSMATAIKSIHRFIGFVLKECQIVRTWPLRCAIAAFSHSAAQVGFWRLLYAIMNYTGWHWRIKMLSPQRGASALCPAATFHHGVIHSTVNWLCLAFR